jgi:hypothetical protein
VDDGLGFLEVGDGQGTAQAADAALLVATLGEAVVEFRPGVCPDSAGVYLAADPPADVDVIGEKASREAVFGSVGPPDRVGLGVENLESSDWAEDFLLDDIGRRTWRPSGSEPGSAGSGPATRARYRTHVVRQR